jgi:hypothetical protein
VKCLLQYLQQLLLHQTQKHTESMSAVRAFGDSN